MIRISSIFCTVLMGLGLLSCSTEPASGQDKIAQNLNAQQFQEMYTKKGGQMVDVRTAEEVAEGYIEGAVNIDFYSEEFQTEIEKLDKNEPVFVYCAAGGRSGKSMKMMSDLGFKEVFNLENGFSGWVEGGMKVKK